MDRETLDQVISDVYEYLQLQVKHLQERYDLLHELQMDMHKISPYINMEMIGSTCNGFGSRSSDVDICLTVLDFKLRKDEKIKFIKDLGELLQKFGHFSKIRPVPKATVPIVEFIHRQSELKGDISLEIMSQHKTCMLSTYALVDFRVRTLGCIMKYLVKQCKICDVYEGSLSSYAYILMVLYFLQQRSPPVIPVLQELYDESNSVPEEMVDDCNVWFFSDIAKLPQVWPRYGNNKESVGELWLGLLKFYAEDFNYKKYVISIRQKNPLRKSEKWWENKRSQKKPEDAIVIEDPFVHSHNLAEQIEENMNDYIRNTFKKGLKLFDTPVTYLPLKYEKLQDYLFDPEQLTDGPPPNRKRRI